MVANAIEVGLIGLLVGVVTLFGEGANNGGKVNALRTGRLQNVATHEGEAISHELQHVLGGREEGAGRCFRSLEIDRRHIKGDSGNGGRLLGGGFGGVSGAGTQA